MITCHFTLVKGTKCGISWNKGAFREPEKTEHYVYCAINFPFLGKILPKWGVYFDVSTTKYHRQAA